MDEYSKIEQDPQEPIDRFRKKPRGPILPWLLPAAAIISGVLAGFALPEILGSTHWTGYLKVGLIALLATMIAYGVNRLAIDRGAFLAAKGMIFAFALSVGSIFGAGTGFWMATYPGLVLSEVELLRLQGFAAAQRAYIRDVIKSSETSAQVVPLLDGIIVDLTKKHKCEIADGCMSIRGSGTGSTSNAIDARRQQAESMAGTVKELERSRNTAAARLAELEGEFQSILADASLDLSARRVALQDVQAAMDGQLARLQKAVPTAVIGAYAEDLQQGALINNNANASTNLSIVLEGYGRALSRVIDQAEDQVGAPPAFPAKTGVSDTLTYIWHFLPVAIIVAMIELIFPATLWFYTYFAYMARVKLGEDAD